MTAVFMLNNSLSHHISHSDEPLPYHLNWCVLDYLDVHKKAMEVGNDWYCISSNFSSGQDTEKQRHLEVNWPAS